MPKIPMVDSLFDHAETTFATWQKDAKFFENNLKPCCVGIHWKALPEYSQMSTHLTGFQLFF